MCRALRVHHLTCFKFRVRLELPVLIVVIRILLIELARPSRIAKLLKRKSNMITGKRGS